MLLVGDHAQLGSVSAGGGFGMLARTGTPTQLHSLWRFTHQWEAQATRGLRTGDPAVIEDYRAHGRLHTGTPEAMLDEAYQNWAADRAAGRTSILVAADTVTVTELNTRAHDDALARGRGHRAAGHPRRALRTRPRPGRRRGHHRHPPQRPHPAPARR